MKKLAILAVTVAIVPMVAGAQRKLPAFPVIAIPPPPAPPGPQALVAWRAESVRCADADVPRDAVLLPPPTFGWQQAGPPPRMTLDFAVDTAGRPIDIRRTGDTNYVPNADDLAPSLAASSFAPGPPRRDCRIAYVATQTPVATADVQDLIAATIETRPSRQVIDRVKPANSDCFERPPAPLLRGFPDFAKLPGSVGRQQWSMVRFDIDDQGKPVAIGTVTGTNDSAFDSAARAAVAKSRFAGGKRTGCLYPYWKSAIPRPAPDIPGKEAARPADATCPADLQWATQPVLTYPANYRKRGIEGWAIVAFDAAPWGATGNVRVIAAEPSADFGTAAVGIVSAARLAPSNQGYVGCVERVRYVMARSDTVDAPAY